MQKPEELAGLYSRDTKHPGAYRAFSYPNYVDIRDHNQAFTSLAALNMALVGIQEGDHTRQTLATVVSSNYFSTLGVTHAQRPSVPGGRGETRRRVDRHCDLSVLEETGRRSAIGGQASAH